MFKNKKILVLMLCMMLAISAFACAKTEEAPADTATAPEQKTEEPKTEEPKTEEPKTEEPKTEESKEEPKEEAKVEMATEYPVSIEENIDGSDFTFTFDKSPERVMSMSQATTEIFLALGLKDKMVGTAFLEEEIYPPLKADYDSVKVVAEKWPSFEEFMAVNPDFATGWGVPFTKRAIPAQQIVDKGIAIYVPSAMTNPDADLYTMFDDFLKIGQIFDNQEFCQNYVDEQKAKLEGILANLKDKEPKRVFLYDSEGDQPFTVFKGYTTSLMELVGAHNVMSDVGSEKTWGTTSWEVVVKANPQYIIVIDYGVSIRNTDDFDAKVEKIKSNPMLADVDAVKNDNFIRVKLSEITPGVRSVDSLERLSETIHAE